MTILKITNITVTRRALVVLRKHVAAFKPLLPGDVFGLVYISSFTNPDGTGVVGFMPGYMPHSISPVGLSDIWILAKSAGASDFLFMPKFEWVANKHYVVDLTNESSELFSIGL